MRPPYLVASCANADDILQQNLLASPDIQSGALPVRLIRHAHSASAAYAAIVDEHPADIVIFVHQDAYLPRGFRDRLDALVLQLDRMSSGWAVAGVYGSTAAHAYVGYLYDGSNGRVLGEPVPQPVEVAVLDEVLIVVRIASGVNFDPQLPGFHLYGTQIAMDAAAKGQGVFVGDLRVIHNSRSILDLGKDYESAWVHLAKRWGDALPRPNLCCGVTARSRWPLWKWRVKNRIKLLLKRRKIFDRAPDARIIAQAVGFE